MRIKNVNNTTYSLDLIIHRGVRFRTGCPFMPTQHVLSGIGLLSRTEKCLTGMTFHQFHSSPRLLAAVVAVKVTFIAIAGVLGIGVKLLDQQLNYSAECFEVERCHNKKPSEQIVVYFPSNPSNSPYVMFEMTSSLINCQLLAAPLAQTLFRSEHRPVLRSSQYIVLELLHLIKKVLKVLMTIPTGLSC